MILIFLFIFFACFWRTKPLLMFPSQNVFGKKMKREKKTQELDFCLRLQQTNMQKTKKSKWSTPTSRGERIHEEEVLTAA